MKARTFILTTGAALAIAAPAAHAGTAANGLACSTPTKHAVSTARVRPPFFSPLNPRGLQTATASRVETSCAATKAVTIPPTATRWRGTPSGADSPDGADSETVDPSHRRLAQRGLLLLDAALHHSRRPVERRRRPAGTRGRRT